MAFAARPDRHYEITRMIAERWTTPEERSVRPAAAPTRPTEPSAEESGAPQQRQHMRAAEQDWLCEPKQSKVRRLAKNKSAGSEKRGDERHNEQAHHGCRTPAPGNLRETPRRIDQYCNSG
jgi:hypothetical protein